MKRDHKKDKKIKADDHHQQKERTQSAKIKTDAAGISRERTSFEAQHGIVRAIGSMNR